MKVYNSFDEIQNIGETVVTIGTFDGVHLGHQQVINRLLEISREENLIPLIITFEPHPQIVLKRENFSEIKLLSTINERLELFKENGIENVVVIPFTYEFSQISPDDFIKYHLFNKANVKKILIGHDHLFGKDRQGNLTLLTRLGAELGFGVEQVQAFHDGDLIISSTKIRHFIQDSNIEKANELLGYPYKVSGIISHGQGRAAGLGYPTANFKIENPHKLLPSIGVYFVSSKINGVKYYGMANLGFRPTLTDDKEPTLEINYFDFDQDIYGETITAEFINFIRKEVKFEGVEKLLQQIASDKIKCLELLNNLKNH